MIEFIAGASIIANFAAVAWIAYRERVISMVVRCLMSEVDRQTKLVHLWREQHEGLAWQIEGFNGEAVREVIRAAESRVGAVLREQ